MRKVTFPLALLLVSFGASAQMVDEPVCYSWNGGHKSAGSFSKCGPAWVVAKAAPPMMAPAPLPAPQIAPSPIMMPMTCAPEPKATKRIVKRKPAPKKC